MKHHFDKMKRFKEYNATKSEPSDIEVSEIIIHLSDLSGPAKKWNISNTWSKRCN